MFEPAAVPLSSCATISGGDSRLCGGGKGEDLSVKPRPDDLTFESAATSLHMSLTDQT